MNEEQRITVFEAARLWAVNEYLEGLCVQKALEHGGDYDVCFSQWKAIGKKHPKRRLLDLLELEREPD